MHKSLAARFIGFGTSLILTLLAFLIVVRPEFFHLDLGMDILVLLILAVLQFIAQSICFLNVWGEEGPRWNFLIYLSTLSIVLIIIVFSIWIMNHLNYNMMM